MATTSGRAVHGWVARGWEGVRDAFAANIEAGREVGAAFAAYHRGRKVVDLWGGVADGATGRPWEEDTIVLVYSTTKGATALCANRLLDEGRLELDAPVATWWPEFAAAGKAGVTVEHLLSHRAGLAWVDGEMTADDALAWEPVVEALAAQTPNWEPGTRHGYHATTFGWLVGELVRRATGERLGARFASDIAEPLGLDFWIGLPEAEEPRVATLEGATGSAGAGSGAADGAADAARPDGGGSRADCGGLAQLVGADTPLGRALGAPGGAFARQPGIWNTRELRAAEVPAANGVGDARSVARMYAACLGEVDGVRLLSPRQLEHATARRTTGGDTVLFDLDLQFGLGFMLHSSLLALGGPRSFGHFGFGGSVGWADPEAELAFGYVMNRLDLAMAGDPRSYALIEACYGAR